VAAALISQHDWAQSFFIKPEYWLSSSQKPSVTHPAHSDLCFGVSAVPHPGAAVGATGAAVGAAGAAVGATGAAVGATGAAVGDGVTTHMVPLSTYPLRQN